MFYVRLDGGDDAKLEFLGYVVVAEDPRFNLYRDHIGDEHIVYKNRPYLYVDDLNDAELIASWANRELIVIQAPPQRR